MKMDYIVVTKNDIKTIDNCIRSIKRLDNVHHLIVVASKKSTDCTMNYLDHLLEYDSIDILLKEDIGLAFARRLGIGVVSTDFFVFVDADVKLSKDWNHKMEPYLKDDVGAICGRLYRNKKHQKYLNKYETKVSNENTRLFTHNTIIRTAIVKDWFPSDKINAYEDHLLTKHIISKGYKCLFVPVNSYHAHRGSPWKESIWGGTGIRLTGCYTPIRLLKNSIFGMIGGLRISLKVKDFKFFYTSIVKGIGSVYGYIRFNKYSIKS